MQQQLALEVGGDVLVGLAVEAVGAVGVLDEQALVLLAPREVIAAVVVVARAGNRHLEEVGVAQDRVGRGEAAAGVAEDAHAVEVHLGVASGQLLERGDVIGEAVVAHVAVVGVVKGLRAERGAEGVDREDDEAEFGEGAAVAPARGREVVAGDGADLGSGIDVVDDGVAGVGVEVGGEPEEAVYVGGAVAPLGLEGHGRDPAGLFEARDVGGLDGQHGASVGVADDGGGGRLGGRVAVEEVAAGGGRGDLVDGVLRGEEAQAGAVEADPVEVEVVGVASVLASGGGEVDGAAGLV